MERRARGRNGQRMRSPQLARCSRDQIRLQMAALARKCPHNDYELFTMSLPLIMRLIAQQVQRALPPIASHIVAPPLNETSLALTVALEKKRGTFRIISPGQGGFRSSS